MSKTQLQISKLAIKYNTNMDLVKSLVSWFGFNEIEKILKMKPQDLQKTIRVNFLKTTRDNVIDQLKEEGINCVPLKEISEGLLVKKGWKKIGSCQSYLHGEIMPQGLGSMLAVDALDPIPGETILDIAAAPGGKSCFIGERLGGKGALIANDSSPKRISALVSNLARHGIENVITTVQDGMNLRLNNLDRVLIDAPCTGEGLIVSQLHRRQSRAIIDNYKLQKIQITLLKNSLSLLKPNGICVYSTCSITPIENEEVIAAIIDGVKILDIQTPGIPGITEIHPEMQKAKRLMPSINKCDGFFIIKIKKEVK